jgi:NAD(P)H-flavin reductase
MIKFVLENLVKLKFKDDQIFTTLENRMKCGIGKCGKCNVGEVYVCKDGPVFSYAQYKTLLPDM